MTVKIIGAVLILASSLGVSAFLTKEGKRKVENLEAIIKLIEYIKRNIDAFLTPLSGIFTGYTCEVLDGCGFGDEMRKNGLVSAVQCGYLMLSENADDELLSFAEKLGGGYRDEEVKRCEYYRSVFESFAEAEREKQRRNRDLYRYIPPLGALSLLLVLM